MRDDGPHRRSTSNAKPKAQPFTVMQTGQMGSQILNDLVSKITYLTPVRGRVYIEVDIDLLDKDFFGDKETRSSKLTVEVDLERKKLN